MNINYPKKNWKITRVTGEGNILVYPLPLRKQYAINITSYLKPLDIQYLLQIQPK